jgi:GT2 family glycosyltransferase
MTSINNPPQVCVIIPNYNGRENLRECLLSLRKLEYRNFIAIVVDNVSTDGSCEMVDFSFSEVKLIRLVKRVGYGQAVNEAIRNCSAKYVALLDNDACVDPYWLTELIEQLEQEPTVAIGGSKVYLYGSARELNSAGGLLNPRNGFVQVLGLGEIDRGQYDKPRFLDWVAGCSMLIRGDLISRLGYLDEGYELYREEVDLCFRARRVGYKVLFVPSSVVWHKVSQTDSVLGTKFYRLHRSWIRFCLVNLSPVFAVIGSIYAAFFTFMEALGHISRGDPQALRAAISAILWNLVSAREILARRAFVSWIISNASANG